MKKMLIVVILLMSLASLAQTQPIQYIAWGQTENNPYGMIGQIWNAGSTPRTLRSFKVNLGPVLVCDTPDSAHPGQNLPCHVIDLAIDGEQMEVAFGLSNLEEQNCTAVANHVLGGTVLSPGSISVRVSSQPCTPHGLQYGIAYSGPGNCGGWNYTCTNFAAVHVCYVSQCDMPIPQGYVIQPNTGVTIYGARYKDKCYKDANGNWQSCGFGWGAESAPQPAYTSFSVVFE